MIRTKVDKAVATLTLERTEALNSLCGELLEELDAAIAQLGEDESVHGIVVTGSGRAFSAGADIEEIAALEGAGGRAFAERGQRVFDRIEALAKPVVAAINGFALGGGCELALACHLRIATPAARFGQPEVKLGILPGFGATQRLPRLVGRAVATELILTARILRADEALRIGLVNEVVEPDALLPRAHELVTSIAANGPRAVAASLRAIREGLDRSLADGLALEAELFGELCDSDEMREGTRAFLDKREPRFR